MYDTISAEDRLTTTLLVDQQGTMHTLDDLRKGRLAGARRISLHLGLEKFPREVYDLSDSLEELDLSFNYLSSLPQDFGRLVNLKAVFFFNNQFKTLAPVLQDCPKLEIYGFRHNKITHIEASNLPKHLRWLILTGNQLHQLPSGMGQLQRLQKLMLAGNALTTLPADLGDCQNLELIRLASNQLQTLPDWLVSLPRLAWIAYGGNPLPSSITGGPRSTSVPKIQWQSLDILEKLGEGTSGIISRGIWRQPSGEQREVAVKVFKSALTSDGTPDDEQHTWVAAGPHRNLVSVLGQVVNHPKQARALVLTLIPPTYTPMGDPPDLTTCTRDTYPEYQQFSLSEIKTMALGVAQAAAHLHQQGILHGDLYPHNTSIDRYGTSLVGDFGAASFYNPQQPILGPGLQRIEVRAFGCYLDDTLSRLNSSQKGSGVQALEQLKEACFQPTVSKRPTFSDIIRTIYSIQ